MIGDEVLARTPLFDLADELLGGRKGSGRQAKWPSPVRSHVQTGSTPPMGVFKDRSGVDRWKCFATGETGTAIDLMMMVRNIDAGAAIAELARRQGLTKTIEPGTPAAVTVAVDKTKPVAEREALEDLRSWLGATRDLVGTRGAAISHDWLRSHRITPESAVRNQVGFDPGPRRLWRQEGLPQVGPAVTLPAFNAEGEIVFGQSRNLRPGGPKYVNPSSDFLPNPYQSFHLRHDSN